MAEQKKPELDSDKTIVDVRRPTPAAPATPDSDRTVVAPVNPAIRSPERPADEGATVIMGRPTPPEDSDRTVFSPRAGAPSEAADRTVVRQGGAAPTPAAGDAQFQLVCLSGHARGRQFPLSGAEVLIGSNPSCQLKFAGIESVHAKLVRQADGYELYTVGTLGSVVMSGGRKPTRANLKPGDLLKIGDVVLRYARVGEVFSAEYEEKQFQGGGLATLFAPEYRLYLGLGAGVLVLLAALLLWPSAPTKTVVKQTSEPSATDKARQQEITALLETGEVLFNAGKLLAPPDQPDADNAFAKFNEVLAREPGNEKARAWLKRIDEERDKQRKAREESEKARIAQQRAREEQQRRDLESRIQPIIQQGDAYFDKGQVTEPVGTNALAKYREALKIYPESSVAQERVQKAVDYYVAKGDELRDKNDLWAALESYRKASRATSGKDQEVERRIQELERQLRSGMAGSTVKLVLYRDERGQLFVLDDMDKVPARYRDRAVEVQPVAPKPSGGGAE